MASDSEYLSLPGQCGHRDAPRLPGSGRWQVPTLSLYFEAQPGSLRHPARAPGPGSAGGRPYAPVTVTVPRAGSPTVTVTDSECQCHGGDPRAGLREAAGRRPGRPTRRNLKTESLSLGGGHESERTQASRLASDSETPPAPPTARDRRSSGAAPAASLPRSGNDLESDGLGPDSDRAPAAASLTSH